MRILSMIPKSAPCDQVAGGSQAIEDRRAVDGRHGVAICLDQASECSAEVVARVAEKRRSRIYSILEAEKPRLQRQGARQIILATVKATCMILEEHRWRCKHQCNGASK
jgi:hypothetical protein